MILFPNCKINLGLHILRKRPDGFHDLETCFYPILWQDALEIIYTDESNDSQFTISGVPLNIVATDNICCKAYNLLLKDYPQLPPVKLHLHKTIPTGAGLGGGSADGAFTLLLLNEKFKLGLDEKQLIKYALELGSDCPFFIINKPCIATGRGEKLELFPIDLSNFSIVLINPSIHINTALAFSKIIPNDKRISLKEIIQQPVSTWKDELKNDFELSVFQSIPEIASIKKALYDGGAIYASMTGSGSTVFGLFQKDSIPEFQFPPNYFIKVV